MTWLGFLSQVAASMIVALIFHARGYRRGFRDGRKLGYFQGANDVRDAIRRRDQ